MGPAGADSLRGRSGIPGTRAFSGGEEHESGGRAPVRNGTVPDKNDSAYGQRERDMTMEKETGGAGQAMEALQTAAQLIMEHGGETFRAEETVRRMGEGLGLQQVESFAVPSGLFISYRTKEDRLETSVRRVRRGSTNLTLVDRVNQISRDTAEGKMEQGETLRRLQEAAAGQRRQVLQPVLASAVCAAGFVLLFEGGWKEVLVSAGTAALVQGISLLLSLAHDLEIGPLILGGLLTAMLPSLAASWIPGLSTESVVAGALMPLVPGLAMTNAVQDTLRGDMVSGLSHGASALLTACLIAGGALLSPALIRLMQGGGL